MRWAIAHRVELNIRVINLSFNTTNPSDDLAAASAGAVRLETGVERVVEIDLNASEKKQFLGSVNAVKGLVDACKKIDPAVAKGAAPKGKAPAKKK